MAQTLEDGYFEEKYREHIKSIAVSLDLIFNGEDQDKSRETGFILIIFPFGEEIEGKVNYISNGADREDVIALMKYQIARFEEMPDIEGTA